MSDILDTAEMKEAEETLGRRLAEIFSRLPSLPEAPIACVDKAEWSEDRKTFVLWVTMVDGRYIDMEFVSGEPISISVQ